MRQFKFKLSSVQKLRLRERDTASEAYRQAPLAISKLESEVAHLLHEHAQQNPPQAASDRAPINPQRLLEAQRYQMHLMQRVTELRSQIELIKSECERRRQLLVKREQAVQVIENLELRQRNEWVAAEQSHEQIALDEWAGIRYWEEGNK